MLTEDWLRVSSACLAGGNRPCQGCGSVRQRHAGELRDSHGAIRDSGSRSLLSRAVWTFGDWSSGGGCAKVDSHALRLTQDVRRHRVGSVFIRGK
ncbi:hypothetical protein PoB_004219600 [Plakobranchus ocellatus]|uniref:Uncharacterized protein n=1 Tax=Plakobranchus ocellatus TaxID=259542 RepID=A0AAV4BA54_9GAST|nr:hypothetical protein PoB_004219600 [Plakobranchus ocellatus]